MNWSKKPDNCHKPEGRVSTVYGKEASAIFKNSGKMIQSMLCGPQYVTQVDLNYSLVYILRLVYIYSPNRRLEYIYQELIIVVVYTNLSF